MCGVCGSVSGITRRLSKIKDKRFSSRNPNCADFPTALRDFYELPDHGEAREDSTIEVLGEQTEEESTREALHYVTLRKSTGSLDRLPSLHRSSTPWPTDQIQWVWSVKVSVYILYLFCRAHADHNRQPRKRMGRPSHRWQFRDGLLLNDRITESLRKEGRNWAIRIERLTAGSEIGQGIPVLLLTAQQHRQH